VKCREQASREASPTAAIIDAQSVKCAEKGGVSIDPHGYDAGKRVKGKERHVLVDTQGFVLHAIVTAADIQNRDGGAILLATLFGMFPFLLKLYADGGYQGPVFQKALKRVLSQAEAQIVKRSDRDKGFVVLPKRWVVEHAGLAQQMPETGQGLGKPQPEGARLPARCFHQTHGQKAMRALEMFPDILSAAIRLSSGV
jgi:transposase